ncbi:hypothetical protein QM480_11455 [Flectobacillus sp. DC10W]|jgi:uncharacterized protein (DUF1330 family)|uniref:Lipoprotein n=1 Tax=Flectobacillus longus TaxID=2984207 RepID=A0ABT6YMZ9_9BACT|nr:hypothetical protein [Flectobacillus longus]MDI9864944.1 hypothetical protein [Flectobacillus longus]
MKKIAVLALTISILASCKSKSGSESTQTDSVAVTQADSTAPVGDALYLDDVLACNDYEGLVKKFGAENIVKKATIETGEGSFEATKIFAGTPKEIEVYWQEGKEYKVIGDVLARLQLKDDKPSTEGSPWTTKLGLKPGMTLKDVVALNGKTFTITGLGWDLGGNVVSWEGGKLADKDINIRFNDYSTNSGGLSETEYSQISGDREFDVKHPSIQKLNPIVDQVSVYHKPDFDKELGNKMYKDVEEKQMPKH